MTAGIFILDKEDFTEILVALLIDNELFQYYACKRI